MVSGERKTVATRDQYISEIRYSSNGKSISYDTIVNNTRSRFQVGIDGTGEVAVPLLPFSSRKYTLSPDGTQMAFVEERDGKTDLYVVTKDETNEKRLTRVGVVNPSFSPTWDSTSKYLTFAVRREAEVALYVVGVNGGEPRKITDYYEATTTSL
jgi:TolB protein